MQEVRIKGGRACGETITAKAVIERHNEAGSSVMRGSSSLTCAELRSEYIVDVSDVIHIIDCWLNMAEIEIGVMEDQWLKIKRLESVPETHGSQGQCQI